MPSSADRLESWKEIAAYLKRGVRTVRRWEREEGLPVHRHQHRVLGSVYAFTSEIDQWRATSRQSPRDRVARIVLDALELRLTPEERDRLAGRPIDGVHAYECYVRARHEVWRWRKDAIDHAVQTLHNGLTIIGDNATLYAALGLAHLQYREAGIDVSDRPLRDAETCAQRVFDLEPSSPLGLQLRGWIEYSRGNTQEAVRSLKAARSADADNVDTLLLLSNCYLISGRVAEARPLITRVVALDPLTPLTRCMPGFADLLDGRFAAAIDPYRQMFEMDRGNPFARLFYVYVLVLNRRTAEAAALIADCPPELAATLPLRLASFLVRALAGDAAAPADQELVTPDFEAVAQTTDVIPRMLAHAYALAGAPDPAVRWLAVAVDRGFINYPFLGRHDPFFASYRQHPAFVALLESVRVRWERFEA